MRGSLPAIIFLTLVSIRFYECQGVKTEMVTRKHEVRAFYELGKLFGNFFVWIRKQAQSEDTFVGRCAGIFKKLRMAITFIIFKLGVIVTTLVFLSVLAFKSVGIGVALLIITSISLVSKLSYLKQHHPDHGTSAPGQNIHLHVHNKGSYTPYYDHDYDHHKRYDDLYPHNSLEREAISNLYLKVLSERFEKENLLPKLYS